MEHCSYCGKRCACLFAGGLCGQCACDRIRDARGIIPGPAGTLV